jgi:hypothetical protein
MPHSGFIINLDVKLLLRSSLESFPFLPFFRESQEVVDFYDRKCFEEFCKRRGDFFYYFYSSYD